MIAFSQQAFSTQSFDTSAFAISAAADVAREQQFRVISVTARTSSSRALAARRLDRYFLSSTDRHIIRRS